MEYEFLKDPLLRIALGIIGMGIIICIIAACQHGNLMEKYTRQCLDDGLKDYECFAMLHNRR
jgi:hypothetical protein